MGILRADHPDIMEFVMSKDDKASLQNINISLGVTDEFMQATSNGGTQSLINARTGKESGSIRADKLFDEIIKRGLENR